MALDLETKAAIVGDFGRTGKDTGSPEVQIALLTKNIQSLTEHMKTHPKDRHSRIGLLKMVSRRRKLLDYVRKHDLEKYRELLKRLNLRK